MPRPSCADPLERLLELRSAVAALRPEHVAGQALRVHPGQHRLVAGDVAAHQHDVLGAVDGDAVAVGREVAVRGGQPGLGDPLHVVLVAPPVVDQLLDRDHRQPVLVGELPQLLAALHRAVVVDDLGDHPGRLQPREPGQVDRGLGVPGPHQHAALGVAQREDVAGLHDLERLGRRVDQRPHGVRPVGRRDAGGDAVARVDRDGVRRPHPLAVVRGHQRDPEPVQRRRGHRHADHPRGVAHGERHQLRCRLAGREDQVALVLAVLVVHDDDRLACRDVGHRLLDGVHPDLGRAHAATFSGWGSCSVREAFSHTKKPQTTRTPYTTNRMAVG